MSNKPNLIPRSPREIHAALADLLGPQMTRGFGNITITKATGSDGGSAIDVEKRITNEMIYTWRVGEVFDDVWQRTVMHIEFDPTVPQTGGGYLSSCTPRDPVLALDSLLRGLKLPKK